MTRLRFRLLYLVLMPAIAVAAAILGYYSWLAMSQYARLGAETIAESTLLLVSEKVDQVEQALIRTDNTVFAMVRLSEPTAIEETWPEIADDETPSVRSVLVLDDTGNVVGFAYRGSENARRDYLKIFQDSILPDLELERQRLWRLKHLHATYDGTPYLISYKAVRWESRRFYVIAQHDTAWIVRNLFPELFATEEGKRLYNVVDQNGNRVYGPSLARAGDYLVGRRFPTTLYEWRLQLAPKQAPLLERQSQTRRLSEAALIGIALIIVLLGVGFVIWAADKERRVNALKAEFIANVSHELKTPLSVVRMFAELLLTKRVRSEEKQEQYLELICRESERLSALIENVLDFAALERGKRSYQLREGHLEDVVTRAIDTFRYRIENEGGTVRLSIEEGLPPAMLDEQAVLLSVINLLDNAVKYGDGTPVEVRLSRDRKLLRVSVRDHGPGIPKEDLRRVFERFYRTKRNTSDIRGSGIGLSLVKHIAEAHGGKAWAENAEDGGAIVAFTLRAAPVPVAAAETAEPAVL
jgi:two-component system phosphate regulon sensor histidine kinase PhoR